MAELTSTGLPSSISLGTNVRDTGTINIILPETSFRLRFENPETGPWDSGEIRIGLRQGDESQNVGRVEPRRIDDEAFEWFGMFGLPEREYDEPRFFGGRTDTDSSRIIGQVDPNEGFRLDGIGPGSAEWVISQNGTSVTEPVELTGGPPTIDQVGFQSIQPAQVDSLTVGGSVTTSNPLNAGVELETLITVDDRETGFEIARQTVTLIAPGSTNLGEANVQEVDFPALGIDVERDVRVCAEIVNRRV